MEIALAILLFIALIFCFALSAYIYKTNKKIKYLTKNIENFLKDGTPIPSGFSDTSLSHLETAVSNLQNSVLQEKEFTKNQAKNNTHFISDISHQLKTPLAGLRLFCEMDQGPTKNLHTEKVLELIDKMEKLIGNVLKLEKIRSDTYQMNFSEYELSEILTELQNEFLHIFPEKRISVNGSASFRCDKTWIYEGFANIIKNACEHTEKDGKIDIFIEKANKTVSVIIEDNGGGVPSQELPKLFERFHRTENASPQSTGIGLAVTKVITEKHHGTITAENTDEGLRVTVCFPVIDASIKIS